MQVFATDGKQGKLSHEFFVFRAAMLGVNKVEPLDIRRMLDDSAQFALVRRRFLIAHIHPNIILAQLFVYDTPILIATIITLPTDHVRVVLF